MASSESKSDRPPFGFARECAFIITVTMGQVLLQAGLGQSIAPLNYIGRTFGILDQPGLLAWCVAGYSLTVGTFVLPAGRAGDLYGHRNIFVAGFLWFAMWSLICGCAYYSHSDAFFILSRVFQGMGPAIVIPNAVAILGRTYPPGRRKRIALCIYGGSAPFGFFVGALFSSLFGQPRSDGWTGHWQWAYFVLMFADLAVVAAAFIFIPPDQIENSSDEELTKMQSAQAEKKGLLGKIKAVWIAMDGTAASIGVTGLVLFNIAWNQAPVDGWSDPLIIVFVAVGFLLILLFCFMETRAQYPLLPKQLFTLQTNLIFGCIACGWSAFGIWIYYTFHAFLIDERHHKPLAVVAQFIPVVPLGAVAGTIVYFFLPKAGPGPIMLGALTCFTLSNVFMSIAPVHQTYWSLSFCALIVAPFGMDMSFPAASVVISDFVPREKQGAGASLINTILNYSISLGLGLASTVEIHTNHGGVTAADTLEGYRGAFRMGIGLGGLGMALAVWLVFAVRSAEKKKQHLSKGDAESPDEERKIEDLPSNE